MGRTRGPKGARGQTAPLRFMRFSGIIRMLMDTGRLPPCLEYEALALCDEGP